MTMIDNEDNPPRSCQRSLLLFHFIPFIYLFAVLVLNEISQDK